MKTVINKMLVVAAFAVAMAYLESAVVVYLREIYGIKEITTDMPTTLDKFTWIETGRELATLIMLASIGFIAGYNKQDRIGYALLSFGIWDIFYYLWLNIFIGWPASLFDWDLLFLLPLPWWGPVLSPVLIALLMVFGGIIAIVKSYHKIQLNPRGLDWSILIISCFLALYVFMQNAISALPQGINAISQGSPGPFPWTLFIAAIAGMTFFVVRMGFKK